jgi:flagellar biosynthesis/type III secretory pathway protein FliH
MNKVTELHKIFDSRARNAKTQTVTEEQLDAAKKEAYESGERKGREEANLQAIQRQELLQKELLYNLQLATEKCLQHQTNLQNQISQLILNISIGLFRKVFASCADKAGLDEVNAFIGAQLHQMNELPELVISVHPEYVVNIEESCKAMKEKHDVRAEITIKPADDLEKTDCVISWGKGHIEKKLSNIVQSLSSLMTVSSNETLNKQDQ